MLCVCVCVFCRMSCVFSWRKMGFWRCCAVQHIEQHFLHWRLRLALVLLIVVLLLFCVLVGPVGEPSYGGGDSAVLGRTCPLLHPLHPHLRSTAGAGVAGKGNGEWGGSSVVSFAFFVQSRACPVEYGMPADVMRFGWMLILPLHSFCPNSRDLTSQRSPPFLYTFLHFCTCYYVTV